MEKKIASGIVLALLLIGILDILLTQTPIVDASPTTVLSVDPTSIINPALGTGSHFRVDLTVADVQQLAGFQFILNYDTTVLTAVDYGFYPPLDDPSPSEINDASGYVALSATLHIEDWESGGLTTVDPESIAWIEFIVDDVGISALDLHGPYNGSLLGNIDANPIPHEDVDGFFDNSVHPSAPEFPLGSAMPIAIIPLLFYFWFRRKQKTPS